MGFVAGVRRIRRWKRRRFTRLECGRRAGESERRGFRFTPYAESFRASASRTQAYQTADRAESGGAVFRQERRRPCWRSSTSGSDRRLRSAMWKQWRRGSVPFAELRARGVDFQLAAKTAGSAHGPWRLANSPALAKALPNAYFDSLGTEISWLPTAQPAEPPDADPHVRWCDRES
jgi:hypothetical protein